MFMLDMYDDVTLCIHTDIFNSSSPSLSTEALISGLLLPFYNTFSLSTLCTIFPTIISNALDDIAEDDNR